MLGVRGKTFGVSLFAHDGAFLRRMASLGARRLPRWWLRYSPPVFGVAAAALLPTQRRAVLRNLERIRGEAPAWRDAVDTAKTFATYASCFAETLAAGSRNATAPCATVTGQPHMDAALGAKKGAIVLTMHTGGWEIATPLLSREQRCDVLIVMAAERDAQARRIQDEARSRMGVRIATVGSDPFAALPLMHHLRDGGVIAMQADRSPPSGRVFHVTLLGSDGTVPEGPFRLAERTGAPLVPVFASREGFGRYRLAIERPVWIPRRASQEALALAAQQVADCMTNFLKRHPTQWFHFDPT